MEIFHVSYTNLPANESPGGADRHVLEVLNGLAEKHRVTAFLRGEPRSIQYLDVDRVKFYQSDGLLGYPGTYLNFLYTALKEVASHGHPDLLYAREMPFFLHTSLLSRILDVPQAMEVNGFLPDSQIMLAGFKPKYYYPLIMIEGLNYWLSESLISVSETARNKIIDFYSVDESRIHRVGNGVDSETFTPLSQSKCREETDIPDDEFVVVFMGTFAPWSGIEDLIEALPHLEESVSDVRCLILSGEKDRERIWELSAKFGVDHLLDMRGYIPWEDLPVYLNTADVAVNPLRQDNHSGDSLKTYEYLACGLPIVCSDVMELRPFVEDDQVGLSYQPGNVQQMARKLIELEENEARREQLSEKARGVAVSKYDWSHRLREINLILESLV